MLIQSRKKRWTATITIALLVLALLPVTAFGAVAKAPTVVRVTDTAVVTTELTAVNKVADLNAGQNTDVGDLFIDARGGNEYLVTYMLDEADYYFGQIHFEAINDSNAGFTDDTAIIYSNGGIVPGKLTVKEVFDMPVIDEITGIVSGGTREYSFIYTSGAPVDAFAAHSVVCLATVKTTQVEVQNGTDPVSGDVISDAGMAMVGGGTTVEVREPFGYPDETIDEYNSVWDAAFDDTPAFNNKIIANGAQIIWNDLYSSGPTATTNDKTVYGDVLKVDVPVTVPANATNISGTLYIVTDNAYIAKIGNTLIGSAGFNAANYAARTSITEVGSTNEELLMEVFPTLSARDPSTSDALFIANVVDSAAWNTMITAATPVPLAIGLNTIEIAAMNEYMGPLDGQANGTWYNNPAGVIFFIEYAWDVPHMEWQDRYSLVFDCETAWGMGEDADGSNWSQIITEVPECEAPILVNGGFEAPPVTNAAGWQVFASGTEDLGWTVEWMGTYGGAPATANLELHNATVGLATPDEQLQYAELDSDWSTANGEPASVKIYQDINTCPGCEYDISFAWSSRANTACQIQVYWNDVLVGTYSGSMVGWQTVTLSGLVPDEDSDTRLEFRETGVADSLGMFLDDVTIECDNL